MCLHVLQFDPPACPPFFHSHPGPRSSSIKVITPNQVFFYFIELDKMRKMFFDILNDYSRFLVICTITFLLGCFFVYQCWQIYISLWSHIPCVGISLPFIGNLFSLKPREENLKSIDDHHKRLGDTFLIWVFFQPIVITCNSHLFENILKSSDDKFLEKGNSYDTFRDWIQDGLICSTGKKWNMRRKQLTACFHFNMLKSYLSIMESHSKGFVETLRQEKGTVIQDFGKMTKKMSIGVICESVMGLKLTENENKAKLQEYLESLEIVSFLTSERRLRPFYYSDVMLKLLPIGNRYRKAIQTIHTFTHELIVEAIKHYNEKNPRTFLDTLSSLYRNGEIDTEGLMEETNNFIFAGHDTISASISWLLFNLGTNNAAQKEVQREADLVDIMEGGIEEKIKHMKYIECAIKESLRLRSTVPMISRKLKTDISFKNGMSFPRGTELVFNIRSMHRDGSIWENPDKFIPERFSGDVVSTRAAFAYVPFSAGPRNCIGQRFAMMEMKIALFYILLNFNIETIQKENQITEVLDVVLNDANGIKIRLTERV